MGGWGGGSRQAAGYGACHRQVRLWVRIKTCLGRALLFSLAPLDPDRRSGSMSGVGSFPKPPGSVWCLSPPSFQVSDPDGYGFAW